MKKIANPICQGADPFILMYKGKYYHYATNMPDGFTVQSSDDLINWTDEGYCLKKGDGVMGEKWFWAPELKVVGDKVYMVYVADEHLAVAVADSPLGPFKSAGGKWLSERNAIDGSFFQDNDGKMYLYYVRFDGGNVIYGAPLSDDLTTLDEEHEVELLRASEPWETMLGHVAEGPYMLKHNGKYYLTYTANDYRSIDYAVGYAVSDSPLGPFVKHQGNPVLKRDETMNGPGHHSFTTAKDGKKLICVYHIHNSFTSVHPRLTCVGNAYFKPSATGCDTLVIEPTCDCIE